MKGVVDLPVNNAKVYFAFALRRENNFSLGPKHQSYPHLPTGRGERVQPYFCVKKTMTMRLFLIEYLIDHISRVTSDSNYVHHL